MRMRYGVCIIVWLCILNLLLNKLESFQADLGKRILRFQMKLLSVQNNPTVYSAQSPLASMGARVGYFVLNLAIKK